jgi:hypothetical protein
LFTLPSNAHFDNAPFHGMGCSRWAGSPVLQGVVSSVRCRERSPVRPCRNSWARLTLILVSAIPRHSPLLRLMGQMDRSGTTCSAILRFSFTKTPRMSRRRDINEFIVRNPVASVGHPLSSMYRPLKMPPRQAEGDGIPRAGQADLVRMWDAWGRAECR